MSVRQILLLDTCVLINLLASDAIAQILKVAAKKSFICAIVQSESIYLRSAEPEEGLVAVDLQPFIDGKLLTLCDLETPLEEQLFVNYAGLLDDGEAMSLAIAQARNWHLATDERKARRIFLEQVNANGISLLNTSELIKAWAEAQDISAEKLKSVLCAIENRARYRPPAWDKQQSWWLSAIA